MEEGEYKELVESEKVLSKLIADRKAFENVLEAYKAKDVKKFHKELERLDLAEFCRIICIWICRWIYIPFCRLVCRDLPLVKAKGIEEMYKFGEISARIIKDRKTLENLIEVYEKQDVEQFQVILRELELLPYCILVCDWIRVLICKRYCRILC